MIESEIKTAWLQGYRRCLEEFTQEIDEDMRERIVEDAWTDVLASMEIYED